MKREPRSVRLEKGRELKIKDSNGNLLLIVKQGEKIAHVNGRNYYTIVWAASTSKCTLVQTSVESIRLRVK